MLHNMETILRIQYQHPSSPLTQINKQAIFVKAHQQRLQHVALPSRVNAQNFFVWLTFMIITTKCLFSNKKKLTNIFMIAFFTNDDLILHVNHALFGRQGYCVQIHYSVQQLKGFWPLSNRPIFIRGFLKDDSLTCVET